MRRSQFKVLEKAAILFKLINNGEDSAKLGLFNVQLYNERKLSVEGTDRNYILFDFDENIEERGALEHARNCAYEILLTT